MPAFSEMKVRHAAAAAANYTGRARKSGTVPGADDAWHSVMHDAVCNGRGQFPDDTDESPVEFSAEKVVHDSIGGGVMLDSGVANAPAFRVSKFAADGSEFVMVEIEGEAIALTIEQAFRRGLCEIPIPRKTGRPALPVAQKLIPVPVRLSPAQRDKLQRIGAQRLREWLDGVKE